MSNGGGCCSPPPILPVSQLMPFLPLSDDVGHLHNVGEVMQKHMVLWPNGVRVEHCLQAAQPIDDRGLVLRATQVTKQIYCTATVASDSSKVL